MGGERALDLSASSFWQSWLRAWCYNAITILLYYLYCRAGPGCCRPGTKHSNAMYHSHNKDDWLLHCSWSRLTGIRGTRTGGVGHEAGEPDTERVGQQCHVCRVQCSWYTNRSNDLIIDALVHVYRSQQIVLLSVTNMKCEIVCT